MHSPTVRNEFLRLRIAGLSFARIARQLGVSKPTLIAWSRASRSELDSGYAETQAQFQSQTGTPANQELVELKRRHGVLRQELLSRSLRDIPTSCLETWAGELRQRIEHLEHCSGQVAVSRINVSPTAASSMRDSSPVEPSRTQKK